ncbi:MAG: DNA-processing protein DprA [Lachnospiraceae bacterium]
MLYEYWFASVRPLADKKKVRLREIFETGEHIYYAEEGRLREQNFLTEKDMGIIKRAQKEGKPEKEFEKLQGSAIRFIPFFDKDYPQRLKEIPDYPYALYVKGELPDETRRSAAIVGARRCSPYGEEMALEYGEALAKVGIQIISGMARGIDGAGHRGALNGGGKTFAVLGCGADICYPREHAGLYADIKKNGGILSERCPGEPPLPAYFPLRNRIISALSDIILVMEAKGRSGSLITADQGLEQGKDIYALPGPVTSPLSQGCHHLIRQGAGILISPEELLSELNILTGKSPENKNKNEKELETPENMVYSCLDLFPKSISELIRSTKIPSGKLLQILTDLEIRGLIKEISKNYYIKVRN